MMNSLAYDTTSLECDTVDSDFTIVSDYKKNL